MTMLLKPKVVVVVVLVTVVIPIVEFTLGVGPNTFSCWLGGKAA